MESLVSPEHMMGVLKLTIYGATKANIHLRLDLDQEQTETYLSYLLRKELVREAAPSSDGEALYYITRKGSKYLGTKRRILMRREER